MKNKGLQFSLLVAGMLTFTLAFADAPVADVTQSNNTVDARRHRLRRPPQKHRPRLKRQNG